MNIKKLKEECQAKKRGVSIEKTKTKSIITEIENPDYQRRPLRVMNKGSVIVTRVVLMGRYGMLKCRANFSSSFSSKNCPKCDVVDDESHRINYCSVFRSINLCDSTEKINFDGLFSDNLNEVLTVVTIILKLWDLGCGKNRMRDHEEL